MFTETRHVPLSAVPPPPPEVQSIPDPRPTAAPAESTLPPRNLEAEFVGRAPTYPSRAPSPMISRAAY